MSATSNQYLPFQVLAANQACFSGHHPAFSCEEIIVASLSSYNTTILLVSVSRLNSGQLARHGFLSTNQSKWPTMEYGDFCITQLLVKPRPQRFCTRRSLTHNFVWSKYIGHLLETLQTNAKTTNARCSRNSLFEALQPTITTCTGACDSWLPLSHNASPI